MYGSTSAAPSKSNSSSTMGKHRTLLRELSDDDNSDAESSTSSISWTQEFAKYYDSTDTIPEGMSVVEWWGVSDF